MNRAPRTMAAMLLGALFVASCELVVGIPDVTLSTDGGAKGTCTRSADGGMRQGPAMARIDSILGSYCIDTTEVTVAQFNDFVLATGGSLAGTPAVCTAPDAGARPTPPVDHTSNPSLPVGDLGECHAWAYCAWAGKRLCGGIGTSSSVTGVPRQNTEWVYACINGVQNLAYPYGTTSDATACNIDNSAGAVPVASKPACRGVMPPYDQIYDMVGNVWEFVNDLDRDDGASVSGHGGSWTDTNPELDSQQGGCQFETGFNGVIFDYATSGFRCCADLEP